MKSEREAFIRAAISQHGDLPYTSSLALLEEIDALRADKSRYEADAKRSCELMALTVEAIKTERDAMKDEILKANYGEKCVHGTYNDTYVNKLRSDLAIAVKALEQISRVRAATIFIEDERHVAAFFIPVDEALAKLKGTKK